MIELSREAKEAFRKVTWRLFRHDHNLPGWGYGIWLAKDLTVCTSLYLKNLGIRHAEGARWCDANDGAPWRDKKLRAALLKACGLKEPR